MASASGGMVVEGKLGTGGVSVFGTVRTVGDWMGLGLGLGLGARELMALLSLTFGSSEFLGYVCCIRHENKSLKACNDFMMLVIGNQSLNSPNDQAASMHLLEHERRHGTKVLNRKNPNLTSSRIPTTPSNTSLTCYRYLPTY